MPDTPHRSLPALKVNQWLSDWDDIGWKPHEHRSEPLSANVPEDTREGND